MGVEIVLHQHDLRWFFLPDLSGCNASTVVALRAARAAGVQIRVGGGDLLLKAATPPSSTVIDLLSRYKAEVMELLRPGADGRSTEDWQVFVDERAGRAEFDGGLPRPAAQSRAFAFGVAEWLNPNPDRHEWVTVHGVPNAKVKAALFCLSAPSPEHTHGCIQNAGGHGTNIAKARQLTP